MANVGEEYEATTISCPACAGVLSLTKEGSRLHPRLKCSVGHTFSILSALHAKEEEVERVSWALIALLEHLEMINGLLAEQVDQTNLSVSKESLARRTQQARQHAGRIREMIEETETTDISQELHERGT